MAPAGCGPGPKTPPRLGAVSGAGRTEGPPRGARRCATIGRASCLGLVSLARRRSGSSIGNVDARLRSPPACRRSALPKRASVATDSPRPPSLPSRLRELRPRRPAHHRLRDHVAPRAPARGGEPRPGFSGRPRTARRQAARRRGGARRMEPVSAHDGPARAAAGRGGSLRQGPGPGAHGRGRHGDVGGHRGAGRRAARPDRARRRGGAVPADVRRLPAAGAPRRGRAALRHPDAAALELHRRGSRPRLLAPHPRSCCSTRP